MTDRRYLQWRAENSLPEIEAAIARGDAVEIVLPQSAHHALYMHVMPGACSSEGAVVERRGGAELLHAMSSVAGLKELELLEEPVRRARYSVLLTSPEPTLELLPRP